MAFLWQEPNEPEDESEGEAQEPEFDVKDFYQLQQPQGLWNCQIAPVGPESCGFRWTLSF